MKTTAQMIKDFAESLLEHYSNGDLLGQKYRMIKVSRKKEEPSYSMTCGYALYSPSEQESGLYVSYKRDPESRKTKTVEITTTARQDGAPFVPVKTEKVFSLTEILKFIERANGNIALLADMLLAELNCSKPIPVTVKVKPVQMTLF